MVWFVMVNLQMFIVIIIDFIALQYYEQYVWEQGWEL